MNYKTLTLYRMKRIFVTALAGLMLCAPTFAGELSSAEKENRENKKNENVKYDENGEIIKTGLNFGPLPVVAFDADRGFQYGALLNIYNFGDGSTYPNPKSWWYIEASAYTGGTWNLYLNYDNKEIFNKFEDVKPGHKYYNGVEYVVANGIMQPISENIFGVDEYITEGELAAALGKDIVDSDKEITVVGFAFAIIGAGATKGFAGFFKGLGLACKIMAYGGFNIGGKVTRGLAADYLQTFGSF